MKIMEILGSGEGEYGRYRASVMQGIKVPNDPKEEEMMYQRLRYAYEMGMNTNDANYFVVNDEMPDDTDDYTEYSMRQGEMGNPDYQTDDKEDWELDAADEYANDR